MTMLIAAPERAGARKPGLGWYRVLRIGGAACAIFLLTGWAALAIYFGGAGGGKWRALLAIAFLVLTICAWCCNRSFRKPIRITWSAAFIIILAWFIAIQPSHQRPWKREVAM